VKPCPEEGFAKNTLAKNKKIGYSSVMINTRTTKVPQILIDCDPGADDFFALLWALGLHKK